jgi:hypothetical protein
MSNENDVFYPMARAGLPAITAAITRHPGKCPELERVYSQLSQALQHQQAPATTYHPAIKAAMRVIEDDVPEGADPVVDAAYNVLHKLLWGREQAPAHRPSRAISSLCPVRRPSGSQKRS